VGVVVGVLDGLGLGVADGVGATVAVGLGVTLGVTVEVTVDVATVGDGVEVSDPEAPHAVTVKSVVFDAPPLLTTTSLKPLPATRPLEGSVAVSAELDPPIKLSSSGVPEPGGPPSSCTLVPNDDGGEPKFVPVTWITDPQVPEPVAALMLGIGTGVPVGVAVIVLGVLVEIGVSVGVSVAPSGAMALNPDVMHGRNPSA
jgi:hypothetical protein